MANFINESEMPIDELDVEFYDEEFDADTLECEAENQKEVDDTKSSDKKDILISGGADLVHGISNRDEFDEKYNQLLKDLNAKNFKISKPECAKWTERTSNGSKFVDEDFDIDHPDNNQGNSCENGRWTRPEGEFIVDGFNPFDIMQGATGDCWFLSALSAVAERKSLATRVIKPAVNGSDAAKEGGMYRFQFYNMGEWHDIIIDDQIPLEYSARPENSELWVALVEKAFAKFFGSYKNIIGGDCIWALLNLTGGFTFDVKDFRVANHNEKKQQGFDLFDFILKNQSDSIYCASNHKNSETNQDAKAPHGATETIGSNGLVAGHAYALIEVARLHDKSSEEVHEVVQIRNPWGDTEWKGKWSDQDSIWETIRPDEKEKYYKNASDGAFWMSFDDFLTEFEKLDICLLPDDSKTNCHHVIGNFAGGENSPKTVDELVSNFLNPAMTHQVDIIVKEKTQNVCIQLLLDCKVRDENHFVSMNLFSGMPEEETEYAQEDLMEWGEWTAPVLPISSGYTVGPYKHNGHIYTLKPGRYTVVLASAPKEAQEKATRFVFRCMAENVQVSHKKV